MMSGFFMNHPKGTSNTQQKTNIRFNKRIFWAHSSPITPPLAALHKKRHLTRIRRVGFIYRPPFPAKDGPTNSHITRSLETILQKHPGAGIILVGDFNRMKTSYFCKAFHLKQFITNPTRDASILDKIFTNMSHIYGPPKVGSHLGKSDHCMVVAAPNGDFVRKKMIKKDNHLDKSSQTCC